MLHSKLRILLLLLLFFSQFVYSQNLTNADTVLLYQILSKKPEKFEQILSNLDKYRIQIIYTQVNKKDNEISLEHHALRYKPEEYFYPASIVKLPLSLLSLEKINKLKSEGVTRNTRLATDSAFSCQTAIKYDYSSPDSFPSIGNYIKKTLVVSDNDAYCRLYEFIGQSYINSRLFSLEYPAARIVHRFNACDSTQNRFTNGFAFYNKTGNVIWYQPPVYNTSIISTPLKKMNFGEKYKIGKEIINGSKDFSRKNCMPLSYVHDILIRIFYPQLYTPWERFDVAEDDMNFLKTQLTSTPKESGIAEYTDKKKFWDAYTNYLYYGNDPSSTMNPDLKIYNIVGLSYGLSIDCAYFSDTTNNLNFFLSAVIYTNEDGILGDDTYEYTNIAMPFMKELGKTIYEYELNKK